MPNELSPNTQAILLLTAPLIAGRRREAAVSPLSPGEYARVVRRLVEIGREPADLLSALAGEVLEECHLDLDGARIEHLLGRGFQLSQAVEHWQARAIWVVSRADPDYPQRIRKRLGEHAPPVFYGCGNTAILATRGLAVVGSRQVSADLIEYTEEVGRLAAASGRTIYSGGARGIDQAAMRGAMDAGGAAAGVLANGLGQAATNREHREALMDGRLVLISPYDPEVRFYVGHAMHRNKLIYALADAALVVNTDHGTGGTWGGATEQLKRFKSVPVYARSDGETGEGLEALLRLGARAWPNPETPEAFNRLLDEPSPIPEGEATQLSLFSGTENRTEAGQAERVRETPPDREYESGTGTDPAGECFP